MLKTTLLLILFPIACCWANDKSKVIIPDQSIFGHPLQTSLQDFIKKEGEPTGFVTLNKTTELVIYGSQCGFFFTGGKLEGVMLGENIVNWQISNLVTSKSRFHDMDWTFNNQFQLRSPKEKIEKIEKFQKAKNEDKWQTSIDYKQQKLEIRYYRQGEENNRQFFVNSILLRSKKFMDKGINPGDF